MKLYLLVALSLTLSPATLASSYSTSPPSSSLTTWEQIHQTLNLYPLAIDLKNTSLFASVFHPDATANYTGTFSNLPGLQNITDSLLLSVSRVLSQHQLGTAVINVDDCAASKYASAGCTASSSTYFTATLFGLPGGPGWWQVCDSVRTV